MPPLKNIKHEKFAKAILSKPSYAKAYQEVYEIDNNKVASNSASRLLENEGIRNRIRQLMRENELSEMAVITRAKQFVYDDEEKALAWDATKTCLKIYGAFDDDQSAANVQNIQVSIQVM